MKLVEGIGLYIDLIFCFNVPQRPSIWLVELFPNPKLPLGPWEYYSWAYGLLMSSKKWYDDQPSDIILFNGFIWL